jgi:hypothetical protein
VSSHGRWIGSLSRCNCRAVSFDDATASHPRHRTSHGPRIRDGRPLRCVTRMNRPCLHPRASGRSSGLECQQQRPRDVVPSATSGLGLLGTKFDRRPGPAGRLRTTVTAHWSKSTAIQPSTSSTVDMASWRVGSDLALFGKNATQPISAVGVSTPPLIELVMEPFLPGRCIPTERLSDRLSTVDNPVVAPDSPDHHPSSVARRARTALRIA